MNPTLILQTRSALLAAATLLALAAASVSCSTTKGLGKDVEKTGEKIQDAADRNR